jgi:thiosulfate/3-mercaptopyruvate sulfurtransferase
MNHPLLIDTEILQKQLGKPKLVVIDVRGSAAYEYGGHIPGAVHTTGTSIVTPMQWPKACLIPI